MNIPGAVTDPDSIDGGATTVDTDDGRLGGYMARPDGPGPHPGVVIVHEAFGLVEHERDLARRFAQAGYIALAPDLYSRVGPPDMADMASVFATMLSLPDSRAMADLDACCTTVRAGDTSNGRVAMIGFCSGGRQTLLHATSSGAADAYVPCWGGFIDRAGPDDETTENRPDKVIDLVADITAPVFLVGGAEDQNPSPAVLAEVTRRIAEANHTVQTKIYADAGHAFLADYREGHWREAPAHELWDDVMAFFARTLG
ncbi:MAG: dienelactone hydrolase family protein [Acidimicrobiales bacterium]